VRERSVNSGLPGRVTVRRAASTRITSVDRTGFPAALRPPTAPAAATLRGAVPQVLGEVLRACRDGG
jgi:hypothetical protein